MVSTAGIAVWVPVLQHRCGHMVRWMHLCGVDAPHAVSTRRKRHGPAQNHLPRPWDTNRRRMACKSACLSSLFFPPIVEGKREVLFAIISKNTGLLRFLYFTFCFFFFLDRFPFLSLARFNFLCFKTPQGYTKLPDYVSVGQFPRTPLRDLFTAATADTLNLLSKCIIYEPRKRISARDVRRPLFLLLSSPTEPTIAFSVGP